MKRTLCISVILLVGFMGRTTFGQPAPADGQQRQQKEPADTFWASRVIHFAEPPDNGWLAPTIERAAGEHAAVLGVSESAARELLTIHPGDMTARWMELVVDLRGAPDANKANPRAAEFLDGVLASLEERLIDSHVEAAGVGRAQRELNDVRDVVTQRRAQFREIEQEIRHVTGRADASVDAIRSSLPKLDDERQTLKLQVVGKGARQQALAEAIEQLAKSAGQRAKDDPVAAELMKIVEYRQLGASRVRELREQSAISESEVADAEAAVAEARAKLLERQEAVSRASGGELLDTLNRELAMLSIDAAELQAKLAALDSLLAKYVEADDLLNRAADVRRERDDALTKLHEAESRLSAARSSLPDRTLRVIKADEMRADDPRLRLGEGKSKGEGEGEGEDEDEGEGEGGADSQPAQ